MVKKFMVVLGNGHTFITNDLCEEYQCGFPPPFMKLIKDFQAIAYPADRLKLGNFEFTRLEDGE